MLCASNFAPSYTLPQSFSPSMHSTTALFSHPPNREPSTGTRSRRMEPASSCSTSTKVEFNPALEQQLDSSFHRYGCITSTANRFCGFRISTAFHAWTIVIIFHHTIYCCLYPLRCRSRLFRFHYLRLFRCFCWRGSSFCGRCAPSVGTWDDYVLPRPSRLSHLIKFVLRWFPTLILPS